MYIHGDNANQFYCDLLIHSQTSVFHVGDRFYGEYDHPSLSSIKPIADDIDQIIKEVKQVDNIFFSPFEEQREQSCRFRYRIAIDEILTDNELSLMTEAVLLYFESLQAQTSMNFSWRSSKTEMSHIYRIGSSDSVENHVSSVVEDRLKKIGGSEIIYSYKVDIKNTHSIMMTGYYKSKPTITRTPPERCEVLARIMGIGRPHGGIARVEMDIFIPNSTKLDRLNAAYELTKYSRILKSILHDMKLYRLTLTYQEDLKGNFVASVRDISVEPISDVDISAAR